MDSVGSHQLARERDRRGRYKEREVYGEGEGLRDVEKLAMPALKVCRAKCNWGAKSKQRIKSRGTSGHSAVNI